MAWIENKRVVVTGATSGIGREVACRLASLGADVVLACRDSVRGGHVADDINAAPATPRASVMTVDTSDQRSIRAFGHEYRQRYGSLDVLVNNAGVLCPDRRISVDGLELTFATNVMGYYLLTSELLGSLTAASAPRVVNIASTFAFDLDLDDLQRERRPYDGMSAYAQSKACDRLLTWAYARRLQPDGITVNAMAPGLVLDTGLYRDLTPEATQALAQYGTCSITDGADTALWLASSPEVSGATGRFFEQGAEIPCELRDEGIEDRLWQVCEELAGQLDPTG
jgi:NAD(P)-dependent dehydrogenase (short-subunit alcohol dehydrogenase family)